MRQVCSLMRRCGRHVRFWPAKTEVCCCLRLRLLQSHVARSQSQSSLPLFADFVLPTDTKSRGKASSIKADDWMFSLQSNRALFVLAFVY